MDWKVYYRDGSVWTSEQSTPQEITKCYEVVCIQQLEPVLNREILNRWPLYRYDPTCSLWFGTTREGVIERLLWDQPVEGLLCGVPLSRADFISYYYAALNDPDFSAILKNYDPWESPRDESESTL